MVIRRRVLLQRDPPIDWRGVLDEIRRCGFGTGDICFTLNIAHSTLWQLESKGSVPNYEIGAAILKLRAAVKKLAV